MFPIIEGMEYFLNFCWLLLFAPAFWIWRRQTLSARKRHHCSLECLVSLICVVFLLFPVISASDDLHAMRPEMEESGSSKRTLRQAPDQRASAQFHCAPLAAMLTPILVVLPSTQTSSHRPLTQESVPPAASLSVLASRAPPALLPFGSWLAAADCGN